MGQVRFRSGICKSRRCRAVVDLSAKLRISVTVFFQNIRLTTSENGIGSMGSALGLTTLSHSGVSLFEFWDLLPRN